MHSTVVVLFSLLCTVWSKDITLGNAEGRKIFDEVRQASPAIWRQYENVTVIAPDNELISKVVITDMRQEKDGDVNIVNGGDGQKSVTIELKSPTVLRGYDFHIEVYSLPDTIATDAEEHLYNQDVTPADSNESTKLPEIASRNNPDDEQVQSSESTELPSNANSKDIKGFPTLASDDLQSDSTRPARETEENNTQTDVPEDKITSADETGSDYESSSESDEVSSLSENQDKTTESPETPIEDTVADVNADNIRPARETELHTSVAASAPLETDSTEGDVNDATTETTSEVLTTDATTEINDASTTEATVIISPYEQSTFTPIPYDNIKSVPNQPQPLNILDYIKNREAIRPIRRTEDEINEENIETLSVQTDENKDETTPIADETSSIKPDDDTVDLVPPEIDASYNTDFAGSETTMNPLASTTLNNVPRAGRGIDFDSGNENESTSSTLINTDEESTTTTTPASADVTTPTIDEDHSVSSLDDQLRNTRGAIEDLEDANDVNISEGTPQENLANEEVIPTGETDVNQTKINEIIVNLNDFMARDENNKFIYALPIVLIISSENNYPIIKIIAEDNSNNRDINNAKELFPTLPSDESLEPSEYENVEIDRIKGDTPSGDYDQSQ